MHGPAAIVVPQPLVGLPALRTPLLITGIAGVPGFNALPYFRARYPGQVVGLRQRDNLKLDAPDVVPCDAEDYDSLRRLFDQYQFQSVLDAAGYCALKACELAPDLAWRINVDGAKHILQAIAGTDVRLVRLSIDLVFSGDRPGGYVETDPTDPVTVYGKTMAAAEELLLAERPETCILRISLPMGISSNGHAGAIDWIQSRFRKDRPATLFFDEFRTPTYTDCLNELCELTLRNRLQGLYHAGGPRRLSLYQIAQVINRVGGYDPRLLFGMPRHEAGPLPPRAGDVTMDTCKLQQALGFDPFHPWPFDERLVPTHREWHFDRPSDEPGSPAWLAEVLYRNPRRTRP